MILPGYRALWIIVILLLSCSPAQALDISKEVYNLGGELEYLIDNSGEIKLEQILRKDSTQLFVSAKQKKMGSLRPNTVLWLKLRLNFTEQAASDRYILSAVGSDYRKISIYRPDSDGGYKEYITGNQFPAQQREVKGAAFAFIIEKQPVQQTRCCRHVCAFCAGARCCRHICAFVAAKQPVQHNQQENTLHSMAI